VGPDLLRRQTFDFLAVFQKVDVVPVVGQGLGDMGQVPLARFKFRNHHIITVPLHRRRVDNDGWGHGVGGFGGGVRLVGDGVRLVGSGVGLVAGGGTIRLVGGGVRVVGSGVGLVAGGGAIRLVGGGARLVIGIVEIALWI